jgi:hypothetical protein
VVAPPGVHQVDIEPSLSLVEEERSPAEEERSPAEEDIPPPGTLIAKMCLEGLFR